MAVLVGEGHLADGLDAGLDGVALGHVNGPEHAHFQIGSGISHEALVLSCPPAFCRAECFCSRRRRYRTDRARRDGIVVLSPARQPSGRKNAAVGNSAKKPAAPPRGFNPRTDAENEVETPPADTRCGERLPGDVRRFAAADRTACWPAAAVRGRAACAPTSSRRRSLRRSR